MKRHSLIFILSLFTIACATRLLSLDAHWSSDEALWLRRSASFIQAVKQADFSETLLSYHPGVMTMWIAGLRTFFIEPQVDVPNLALARWFIGVGVLIGFVVALFLLYWLFGFWVTVVSFAFLVCSPFLLAQSRRVHTDALATVFCLLAVLAFLLYCQTPKKQHYLIGSGVAFGLACLAKSYSLILLLWVPLCLGLFRNQGETRRKFLFNSLGSLLCFLSCALLTAFVLWPVFWTLAFFIFGLCLLGITAFAHRRLQKETHQHLLPYLPSILVLGVICVCVMRTVWRVLDRVGWAVTTPHEVEHFFLGQVVNDPGWLFYPLVLCIKSTPLMLPLALGGCLFLWCRRGQEEYSRQCRTMLGLVAVVVLFIVCLSLTSKKFSRYLLTVFPILEILAAVGFVAFLKWSYSYIAARFGAEATPSKLLFSGTVFLCLLTIQVIPVLRLHPYYGTYYNLCFKLTDITKIITVGDASGLDIAAQYLNQKQNVRGMKVTVSPLAAESVSRYFKGFAFRTDMNMGLATDYEVVYIRDSQIGRVPQTGTLNGTLECMITLNGIDHVWIYRV
jgi:4-amino-4-deoxy-L-arabinose transferase-like glycosyltransferase